MGLPVWRAPSPEAKDAIKGDVTAPARSPIRRRSPPSAGRRARPTRAPRSPRLLDTDFLVAASRVAPAEPMPRPSSRLRLPPPPVPESRHYARHGDPARGLDSLYAPTSLLRARSMAIPTLGEASRSPRRLPAYTPNFAPAAPSQDARAETAGPARVSLYPSGFTDAPRRSRFDSFDGDDDGSDNNAVGLPPLRRMGRRTIADGPLPSSSLRESWSPASTLDGLGDRERSISPVDDHWDTMLNTVAPDPLAPSADSSFTSAAASASFSNSLPSSRAGSANSNSASSSRTHLTVPSRRHSPPSELFLRACDTSDSDTASDTEEEDVDFDTTYLQLAQQRSRQREHGERMLREAHSHTSRNDQQLGRARSDQLDGPVEASSNVDDELQTLDQELREARAILERLSQRGDVSDEFWASVGLTRSMADRVERLQERERM